MPKTATSSSRVASASKRSPKTLALIAHDEKKADMVGFVKDNFDLLRMFNLVATSTTGSLVAKAGLPVKRYLSGPIGGDAQIASLAAIGKCHGVIFLRDPMNSHPHDPDIMTLLRICDVHDIPLATNLASARLLIAGLKG